MYLVYMGQSGNTGNSTADPHKSHQVYTGLLAHETQVVSMTGEFDALCRRHFGAPLGEAGAPKELRPVDIYQGLRHFSSWNQAKRNELLQDCLNILVRRETPVITAYINKRDLSNAKAAGDSPSSLWENPTEPVISRFLFALNMFLDELSMTSMSHDQIMAGQLPISDFALVVARNGGPVEPRLMTDFLMSEDGQDASAMLGSFCFVEPEYSVGTQLANLCAYFARRWLQNPDHPHPYFEALRDNRVIQVIYPVTV